MPHVSESPDLQPHDVGYAPAMPPRSRSPVAALAIARATPRYIQAGRPRHRPVEDRVGEPLMVV
jgi:hypothetical protein